MSNPNLVKFIRKLEGELNNYADYRKELNKEPQTFVFHKTSLLNETIKQLSKGHGINLSGDQKKRLKELVDDAADELHKDLEAIAGRRLKRPGGRTTLHFDKHTDVPIPSFYKKFLPYSAFTRVKFAYRGAMNTYFTNMQNFLRDETQHDVVRNKSNKKEKKSIMHFFDAGHEEGAGVFEKFLDSKTVKIMSEMDKTVDRFSEQELSKLQKDLKKHEIDLSLQKLDDKDMIIIKIESSSENRSRGQKSGLRSKKLRRQVRAFLNREDLSDLEGSDSLKEKKNKKLRKVTTDPFKKLANKNVKVRSGDLKAKKSSKKPVKKSASMKVKTKRTKSKTRVSTNTRRRKSNKPTSPASNMLQMIGLINKELPATVRKNMVAPRLQNQTGRFANSVKVTEVIQTPQGFPSVGYTYQRRPYEVFEEGSSGSWADGNRDPRDLIDGSIREIAAKMAIGRFYTRRV